MANRNKRISKQTKAKKGVASKKMSTPKGFNITPKETIIFLCYLLVPSLLVSLTTREFHFNRVWLVSIYVITFIGIVAFFLFKFYLCKFKTLALLLGLALSPLYTYIYEARWAARFALMDYYLEAEFPTHYLFTPLSFFYALPFFVMSAIGLVILFTIRSRKNITL